MDQYHDSFGGDQVRVDTVPPAPSLGHKAKIQHRGVVEDNLRYEQYGIPARLECRDGNPYIRDDISKSQRHARIVRGNIPSRVVTLDQQRCAPPAHQHPTAVSVKKTCGKSVDPLPATVGGIDTKTLLFVFIFIVMLYMYMTMYKNTSEIRSAMSGGFQQMRDLIALTR